MARVDPFHGFRFRVELDQVQHGGVSKGKSIVRETKVESGRGGGVDEFDHKFATQTTYGNLTLERGLVDDYLWSWHEDIIEDRVKNKRKTVTIVLQDSAGAEAWRWIVEGAFPVKWTGGDLDGASSQVLVESV